MALADFADSDRRVPISPAGAFRAALRWVAARRAARARRLSLERLLLAPEHRLRDLGIDRHELVAAIKAARR